jgi:hypothetical protein
MADILSELLKVGFLTGSRAFGTEREDSDYDIVYPIQYSDEVDEIIEGMERSPSNYFAGYCVTIDGKEINLIPVHPHEFLPWVLATKAMTATLKESGIVDPIKKYAIFQGIVCLFKGMVSELGTLNEYCKLHDKILGIDQPDFIIKDDFQ